MARDTTKNAGFLSLDMIPEDVTVVGAVIVTMDEAGNYGSILIPESLDALPTPEVQEIVGGYAAQSFELANMVGLDR
ncbi:hypothetical protein SEA_PHINKY_69 [Microbacterium phage Phinky]|nr:hypothetical protein SEA_PHINKY_69 [Microbacterium phage Phinky]